MLFHPGQRVVCVNVTPGPYGMGVVKVRKGVIYTVKGYILDAVLLEEEDPSPFTGWFEWRFRPIVERKTDIGIFRKLLVPNTKVTA